jgi:hypothetical protein
MSGRLSILDKMMLFSPSDCELLLLRSIVTATTGNVFRYCCSLDFAGSTAIPDSVARPSCPEE